MFRAWFVVIVSGLYCALALFVLFVSHLVQEYSEFDVFINGHLHLLFKNAFGVTGNIKSFQK